MHVTRRRDSFQSLAAICAFVFQIVAEEDVMEVVRLVGIIIYGVQSMVDRVGAHAMVHRLGKVLDIEDRLVWAFGGCRLRVRMLRNRRVGRELASGAFIVARTYERHRCCWR